MRTISNSFQYGNDKKQQKFMVDSMMIIESVVKWSDKLTSPDQQVYWLLRGDSYFWNKFSIGTF